MPTPAAAYDAVRTRPGGFGRQRGVAITTLQLIFAIAVGVLLLVAAFFVFRANYMAYFRISGYAINIAACKALVFVLVIVGVAALAWACSLLVPSPGMWRNLAWLAAYSALMSILGNPTMKGLNRAIERWYYL